MAAKLRIFANQGNYDVAVAPSRPRRSRTSAGAPGGCCSARAPVPSCRTAPATCGGTSSRCSRRGDRAARARTTARTRWPTAAACLARGIDPEAVATGLRTFAGVATGSSRSRSSDGVAWVNDSKATNVASTIVALRAFAGGIHLIAGGRGKQQDFSPLAPLVAERCAAVYLIGEAAGDLADALSRHRRAAAPGRRSGARGRAAPARPPPPARSCCCRRRARATTSTRTSRPAATISARSWRRADGARGRRAGSVRDQRATARRVGTAKRSRTAARRVPPPLEHRILMTATLCLLAFGAVMVYSASSPLGVLARPGLAAPATSSATWCSARSVWRRCTCSRAAA